MERNNTVVFDKIVLALIIFIIILIIIAIGAILNEGGMRFLNAFKNNTGGLNMTTMIMWVALLGVFFTMIYFMLHTSSVAFIRPSATRSV